MRYDPDGKRERAAYVPEGGAHVRYNASAFNASPLVTISDPVVLDANGHPLKRRIGFQPPRTVKP